MAESLPVLTDDYTRLHITPLNPTLLTTIIPPSILPNARNISYHSVQTFPEKAYGYIELPKMDAEKIKKKLNGSILQGTKVRIEAARPKKELVLEEEQELLQPKKDKDSKKRKRGQEAIPAAEIGDRSVKRGWTTPSAATSKKSKDEKYKKSVIKSKYTPGPECLFKTVLPPNVAANTKHKEGKPEKNTHKADRETVVHEFSKTTKYATFLRGPVGSKKTKAVAEFVKGKGWVDEDGNIVENVTMKERKPKKVPAPVVVEPETNALETESSESSSSSEEEGESSPTKVNASLQTTQPPEEDPTSSSGSSSEEDSESEASSSEASSEEESDAELGGELETPISTSRPQSSSGQLLNIEIPESGISSKVVSAEIHPLEALYKRPRPDGENQAPKPSALTFNFFGADGDEDLDEESRDKVPLTPFTQKDFEYRGMRSAAPTPDTAHANKRFIWPTDNEEEDDDEQPSSQTRKESPSKIKEDKQGESAESDFQKWFYENRGDTNRAWKKRRKVVAKEQRQRENRKRNDRTF